MTNSEIVCIEYLSVMFRDGMLFFQGAMSSSITSYSVVSFQIPSSTTVSISTSSFKTSVDCGCVSNVKIRSH